MQIIRKFYTVSFLIMFLFCLNSCNTNNNELSYSEIQKIKEQYGFLYENIDINSVSVNLLHNASDDIKLILIEKKLSNNAETFINTKIDNIELLYPSNCEIFVWYSGEILEMAKGYEQKIINLEDIIIVSEKLDQIYKKFNSYIGELTFGSIDTLKEYYSNKDVILNGNFLTLNLEPLNYVFTTYDIVYDSVENNNLVEPKIYLHGTIYGEIMNINYNSDEDVLYNQFNIMLISYQNYLEDFEDLKLNVEENEDYNNVYNYSKVFKVYSKEILVCELYYYSNFEIADEYFIRLINNNKIILRGE